MGALPVLKWAGGKRWFAELAVDDFTDYLRRTGGRFIEPFLGAGSVGLNVRGNRILSDVLEPLIEFYVVLRDHPSELLWHQKKLVDTHGVTKDGYLAVRGSKPDGPVSRAARFFYLNRIGFNGLYRENSKGEFNVPYGGPHNFPDPLAVRDASTRLQGVDLFAADFEVGVQLAEKGDLVYVDPPYHGTFSRYAKGGFGDDEHERLATALYRAHERGVAVVAHNAGTEAVRYWYSEWCEIVKIDEPRRISANGDREKAPCVLVTNGLMS